MTAESCPAVYILASHGNGTLDTGVTSNPSPARVGAHKRPHRRLHAKIHRVHLLVYYEIHASIYAAISPEKQIKGWSRARKIALIEANNPDWRDLYLELL